MALNPYESPTELGSVAQVSPRDRPTRERWTLLIVIAVGVSTAILAVAGVYTYFYS